MAFDVLDEHEQGEQVQKWLRENAMSILIGIGLGLVLLFGWQQWRTHRAQHSLDAAVQFDALGANAAKKDFEAVKQIAAKLQSDYSDTPYGALAAMRAADLASERGDNEAAYASLDWAWQHAGMDAMKLVAGLNLARVQIARNKAQDALDVLDKLPKGGLESSAAELRGDALLSLGRKEDARAAYAEALSHIEAGSGSKSFIEMKLNDLGGAEKKGS